MEPREAGAVPRSPRPPPARGRGRTRSAEPEGGASLSSPSSSSGSAEPEPAWWRAQRRAKVPRARMLRPARPGPAQAQGEGAERRREGPWLPALAAMERKGERRPPLPTAPAARLPSPRPHPHSRLSLPAVLALQARKKRTKAKKDKAQRK